MYGVAVMLGNPRKFQPCCRVTLRPLGTRPATVNASPGTCTFTQIARLMFTMVKSFHGLPASYTFHGSAASAATYVRARLHVSVCSTVVSEASAGLTGTDRSCHPVPTGRVYFAARATDRASFVALSTDAIR